MSPTEKEVKKSDSNEPDSSSESTFWVPMTEPTQASPGEPRTSCSNKWEFPLQSPADAHGNGHPNINTSWAANKANLSFSDTKVEKGESFTYEADIKYLGDTATPTGIIGLVFGATNSTQKTKDFTKETYYYLANFLLK